MDKLDKIFQKQYKLQKALGNTIKINKNKKLKQQYINQMILAVIEESIEILRESPYKNPKYVPFGWKKGQIGNNNNFKKEIIDLMHFLVNLCIVSGMNSKEFYNLYINKNKENHKRKKENY